LGTNSKRPLGKPEGTPRWVPIAGAIVGIGGLVWAIANPFIAKPDSAKAAQAASAPSPSVSVSGSGSVGVGTMTGGQINLGAQPPASAPLAAKP
jgi:hypothetical protein